MAKKKQQPVLKAFKHITSPRIPKDRLYAIRNSKTMGYVCVSLNANNEIVLAESTVSIMPFSTNNRAVAELLLRDGNFQHIAMTCTPQERLNMRIISFRSRKSIRLSSSIIDD